MSSEINEFQDQFPVYLNIIQNVDRNTFEELDEIIQKNLNRNANAPTIAWPAIYNTPINEFKEENYITSAFPKLFPTGKADLRSGRKSKLTDNQYFTYLLSYKDQRFSMHPRFRYFALNSLLRWKSNTNAKMFIKRNFLNSLTSSQIVYKLMNDQKFVDSVRTSNKEVRSTNSYWYLRTQELFDMIDFIGPPNFFITLSAADQFWPDLRMLLDSQSEFENETNQIKHQIQLLNNNPNQAAFLFNKRVTEFMRLFLKKEFDVTEFWYRVEFQKRGSPHIHGLFWCNLPDDVDFSILNDEINEENAEKFRILVNYIDSKVSCIYPNLEERNEVNELSIENNIQAHPCTKLYSQIPNFQHLNDLNSLLDKCQLHSENHSAYCLRDGKCRFGFPKELVEESKFVYNDKKKQYDFVPKRNHPFLNSYNRYILEHWRANIDVQPICNFKDVLYYIAKYSAKSEPKNNKFLEFLDKLTDAQIENSSSHSILSRALMKLISARDYSAQEVCYILAGYPLYHCSRPFRSINITLSSDQFVEFTLNSNNENHQELNNIEDDLRCENDLNSEDESEHELNTAISRHNVNDLNDTANYVLSKHITEYVNRPDSLESLNLKQFFSEYKYNNDLKLYQKRKETKFCILRIFPKSKDEESKLMTKVLINISFRSIESLRNNFDDWYQIYDYYKNEIDHNLIETNINQIDELLGKEDQPQIQESDSDLDDFNQFEHISSTGYFQQIPEFVIGTRDFDRNANWHHNTLSNEEFQSLKKFITSSVNDINILNDANYSSVNFNNEQQNIIDLFENQVKQYKLPANRQFKRVPRKVIVEGRAGSGKSTVLKYMTKRCQSEFGDNSYILLAPTGISAININGSTIQSKLKIFTHNTSRLNELTGVGLSDFQTSFKFVKFVFIDEMSMIGQSTFDHINTRLNQAKATKSNSEFGDLCVYLFGDFNQLPPVKQHSLYKNTHSVGRILFKKFTKYFKLNTSVRQQGESQQMFRSILNRIGDTNVTIDDWKELQKRCLNKITNPEDFKDALTLYTRNQDVHSKNLSKLLELNQPILLINSIDNNSKIENTDVSKVLPQKLTVCVGCRVMLRTNLNVKSGLVNGALGTVTGIFYKENSTSFDTPEVIFVKFDNYKGSTIYDEEDEHNIINGSVPIFRISRSYNQMKRTQFPLIVAYAITVHKSQGLTLDKAIVQLGQCEQSLGISYVALSRVRKIEDLAFETSFD